MGISKVVADRILSIPHLQHIDYLLQQGIARKRGRTRRRGDLAGRDHAGAWHVLEAKGSSYPFQNDEFDYAKSQARRIRTIDGSPPATRDYCCSSFNEDGAIVFLADPNEEEGEDYSIEIDTEKFLTKYYRRLYEALAEFQVEDLRTGLPEIDRFEPTYFRVNNVFTIGILSSVIQNLDSPTMQIDAVIREFSEVTKTIESEYVSAGGDGIILIETPTRG